MGYSWQPGPFNTGCTPEPECGRPCTPPPDPCNPCPPHDHCKPCPPPPPPCPPPPIHPIHYVPGMNTQEQMARTIRRVNECIEQWNSIQKNCYAAMQACVGACISNDVYYDADEVHFEDGYSKADRSPYTIITIKPNDKAGKPIRIKLGLAYNNTTNSNVKQSIEEVSLITNANAIITAVNPETIGWQGAAMYQGMPIASSALETDFVMGFNQCGQMQIFRGDVTTITLQQNGMVDVIGGVIPIIEDGKITAEAQALTTKSAVTAVGYKSSTGEKVFLSAGAQESTGIQGVTAAQLLLDMGCTTAAITFIQTNSETVTVTGGMEFLGKLTAAPNGLLTPVSVAYWYVSKRPACGWTNKFTSEIADLVQTTGTIQNEIYALKNNPIFDQVEELKLKVKQLEEQIANFLEMLQQETNNRVEADQLLQENINTEVNRATAAEEKLQQNIDAETERATAAEDALRQQIVAETDRATAAEDKLSQDITNETSRAQAEEARLQAALSKEQQDRIAADSDLERAINAEILARSTADTELRALISAEEARAKKEETELSNTITEMLDGSTPLPYVKLVGDTMTGPLVLPGAPTADLEAATKKYVDDAVAAGGGGGAGGDVTKEYVDEQVSALNTTIAGKVSKSGDTMTGPLVLSAAPTADMQAATKKYVDDAVAASEGGTPNALPLTGGTMTGNIVMSDGTYIKINTPPVEDADAVSKGYLDQHIADADTKYLQLTGGTMSGDLVMAPDAKIQQSEAPVDGNDLVNKTYTDAAISSLDTELDAQESRIDALETTVGGITGGTTPLPYVQKAGDTMTGPLEFEGAGNIRGHNGHIDIDSAASTGAVYINRTNNGTVQEGGTGELHVTGIHAPQALALEPTSQLILQPGTTVQCKAELAMNAKRITGLAPGVDSTDAATVGQIGPKNFDDIPIIANLGTVTGKSVLVNRFPTTGSVAGLCTDQTFNKIVMFIKEGTNISCWVYNPETNSLTNTANFVANSAYYVPLYADNKGITFVGKNDRITYNRETGIITVGTSGTSGTITAPEASLVYGNTITRANSTVTTDARLLVFAGYLNDTKIIIEEMPNASYGTNFLHVGNIKLNISHSAGTIWGDITYLADCGWSGYNHNISTGQNRYGLLLLTNNTLKYGNYPIPLCPLLYKGNAYTVTTAREIYKS